MERISASAPGKVLLMGEYAVLDGCPALCLAVNRRATVSIDIGMTRQSGLLTSLLPGIFLEFTVNTSGELHWLALDAPSQPVRQAFEHLLTGELLQYLGFGTGCIFTLDSQSFYVDQASARHKLGLGSSAAIFAAMAAATDDLLQQSTPVETIIRRHRAAQGDAGSGVDVACSVAGGLVRYRLNDKQPEIHPLDWPVDFPWSCVWAGQPTSTADMVVDFQRWQATDPFAWESLKLTACGLLEKAEKALVARDLDGWLDSVGDSLAWLRELGQASKMPIVSPIHEHFAKMALESGCVYKPSGAGSGDIGIAFGASEDVLEAFNNRVMEAGYQVLELDPELTGLSGRKRNL